MAAPVLDNANAWVEQFNSEFSITFSTTGTGKLLFLHVGAFFGDTNLPTITGTTLTWTKLADVGNPSDSYAGVYWAVTSGALTDEVATCTLTGSAAIGLQVDEWSDATVYTGLTDGVDYGTATQQTDASVTTTPNVTVTTYAADSHVRGVVVGFIGEAWGAGTNTSVVTSASDAGTLARTDNPQTSTGSYNIEAVNGSGNTDSWRGFSTVGYEVLGISGGGGGVTSTGETGNGSQEINATGSVAAGDSITLTDLTNNRIYQRISGTRDIIFSGTNTGETPDHVQVQIYASDGSTVEQAWTTLTSDTITASTFTGTLTVPEGGMYRFAVRSRNSSNVVLATGSVSTNLWGVGDNLLITGDSDMWRLTSSDSASGLTPNTNIRRFDYDTETWETAGTDGVAITFANNHNTATGVPVGIIEGAKSGGLAEQFGTPATADYIKLNSITSTVGDCAWAVMNHGANDCFGGTLVLATVEGWLSNIESLLRTNCGASLPIYYHTVSRYDPADGGDGSLDDNFTIARQAQDNRVKASALNRGIINSNDAAMSAFHFTATAYQNLIGPRLGQSISYELDGGSFFRGPYITSLSVTGTTGTATVVNNGTSLTVDTNHGLVAEDGSGSLPISSVSSPNATTLTITFGRTTSGTVLLSAGIGEAPHAAGEGINDNTTYTLALEPLFELEATSIITSAGETGQGTQTIDSALALALSGSGDFGQGEQTIDGTIGLNISSTGDTGNGSQEINGSLSLSLDIVSDTENASQSIDATIQQLLDSTIEFENASQTFSGLATVGSGTIISTGETGQGSQTFDGVVTVELLEVTSTGETGNGNQTFDGVISVGLAGITSTAESGQGSQSIAGILGLSLDITGDTENASQSFDSNGNLLLDISIEVGNGSQTIDGVVVQTIDITGEVGQGDNTFDGVLNQLIPITSTAEFGQGRQSFRGTVDSGESEASSDYIITYRRRRK